MEEPIIVNCSGCLFGIHPVRPLVGIPADCRRAKIKLRPEDLARVILRFDDRTEDWILESTAAGWRPLFIQAVNARPSLPHSTPAHST